MRFAARVRSGLTKIAAAHPGETLLVVVHAGVLDIAWRMATEKRLDEPRSLPALNAAPNWFVFENDKWSLVDWARADTRAPILAPYEAITLARREASRVLLVNPKGETLLLKFASRILPDVAAQGYAHFWGQPGGAREAGESFEACAAREIREETGLSGVDVGAAIASREFPLAAAQRMGAGRRALLSRVLREFRARFAALTEGEASYVLGWKWWRPEDIAASKELIYPEALANMLTNVGVG